VDGTRDSGYSKGIQLSNLQCDDVLLQILTQATFQRSKHTSLGSAACVVTSCQQMARAIASQEHDLDIGLIYSSNGAMLFEV
jgi:hypothetical protein